MKEKFLKVIRSVTRDVLDDIQRIELVLGVMLGVPFVYFGYDNIEVSRACLCNGVVEVLLVWGVTSFLRNGLKRGIRFAFFLFVFVDFIFNLFCYLAIGNLFGIEELYLVLGTNEQEAQEFWTSYFSVSTLLLCLVGIGAILFLYCKRFWRIGYSGGTAIALLLVSAICLGVSFKEREFKYIAPLKEYLLAKDYMPTPDLRAYRHSLQVEAEGELPQNVVVIIGESFAKHHSSLYGYEKRTNPGLETLANSGQLTTYSHVTSPGTTTSATFEMILSTFKRSSKTPWYECVTLFDIFGSLSHTYWLSNQCHVGIYDNVQSSYADLAQTEWFSDVELMHGKHYDEVLVPVLKRTLEDDHEKRFIILNIMGQHEIFGERYPATSARFTEEDYPVASKHQQESTMAYDNATLYNDSVICTLFHALDATDAVAFYFPDHGMDVFDTDEDYAGHARRGEAASVEVATQIPFMVYTTSLFEERHHEMGERIRGLRDEALCTEDFLGYLEGVMGMRVKSE